MESSPVGTMPQREFFGYTAEEMIGASILSLSPATLHSDEKTIMACIRAGRRVEHFETVRMTKDGRDSSMYPLPCPPLRTHMDRLSAHQKSSAMFPIENSWSNAAASGEDCRHWPHGGYDCPRDQQSPRGSDESAVPAPAEDRRRGRPQLSLLCVESELGRVSHIAKPTLGYYREHASASLASLAETAETCTHDLRTALHGDRNNDRAILFGLAKA